MTNYSFVQRRDAISAAVSFVMYPSNNQKNAELRRKRMNKQYGALFEIYELHARNAMRIADCIRGYEIRTDELASAANNWETLETIRDRDLKEFLARPPV